MMVSLMAICCRISDDCQTTEALFCRCRAPQGTRGLKWHIGNFLCDGKKPQPAREARIKMDLYERQKAGQRAAP